MSKLKRRNPKKREEEVAKYYDEFTDGYLSTYGNTIQAFRPENTADLHDYVIANAGIEDGQYILDAGCGVAGPSTYFSSKKQVNIEGITISPQQKDLADKYIAENEATEKIKITLGDYHQLSNYFQENSFDLVLFLESLGHAADSSIVLEEVWKVTKPGGCVYIKDFFPFEILDSEKAKRHNYVIERINSSYTYNVLSLQNTVKKLRELGFELIFIKKFEFEDDIRARADFEDMHAIDLFGDMEEFRVAEWLELKFRKPISPLF